MIKRSLALSLLAVIISIGLVQQRSIATAGTFDWEAFDAQEAATAEDVVVENDGDDTASNSTRAPKKKSGNGFMRALGAPFRAIGKLFTSGGKKDQQQQARRVSKQDAKKFESIKVSRVKDALSDTPSAVDSAVSQSAGGTHLQRGQELLVTGDMDGAIAELSIAASSDSQSGEARNFLGVAYENKGLRQRALESFKAAVEIDKNNAQFLNNYGFLLYKNGNLEAATKQLKRAAKLSPNDARIWNNLGLAQCQRGKFDDAFQSFVRAGGEFDGRVNMAAQLLSQGLGGEAIKHLEVAHALRPNSTEVLTRLAGLYNMTGRISDAATARRTLLALQTSAEAQK